MTSPAATGPKPFRSEATAHAPVPRAAHAVSHPSQAPHPDVLEPSTGGALARAAAIEVPVASRKATAHLTFAEMEAQNADLINAQAAAVSQTLNAKGLSPADVTFVFSLDVTGHPVQVCVACGRIGHDYKPTMVRQDNPEINMLEEYFVVARAVADKVGVKNGFVVYDEEVAVVRDPSAPKGDREEELLRFKAFLKRHKNETIHDGFVSDWMVQQQRRWTSADASRQVVGEPADVRALEVSQKLLTQAGGARRWMMVAKAQAPRTNLKAQELMAKAKGIRLSGVAVGENARYVAPQMFAHTVAVEEMHGLRQSVDAQVSGAASQD